MDNYLEKMAELFEEDTVLPTDIIVNFNAWDSLTSLSIIAFVGDEFKVNISAAQILEAKTIGGLFDLINSK